MEAIATPAIAWSHAKKRPPRRRQFLSMRAGWMR